MITEESINFFRNIPPFQFLDEGEIRTIAGNLSLEFTPKNSLILTQDGPPSDSLRVIKKGGVKVYMANDDDIVIDYKSEGDSFGYLSLISGDKSRANVQAVEDTLCYLIPRDIILEIINRNPHFSEYFMKSFFKNYLDKTYREMRNRNLLFKEGEKLLYTTPVNDIVSKKPVAVSRETSIREAAAIMSEHGISSIVIEDSSGELAGIITDRDLRDKVVAQGADPAGPVTGIMSSGLVTVDGQSTCFDALSKMIRHNIHHMLVTDGKDLAGVVTNHDFMLLQGTSPLSILKNIDRQKNTSELKVISGRIDQIISLLLKEGVSATHILRIITELHDRLIKKIIDLSIKEIGTHHCPFALFVYGAEGRKEETFKTVFRCAIVYNTQHTYCEKKDMEEFSNKLIAHMQKTFTECDLPPFDVNPLGAGVPIYGDISEWEKNILAGLRSGKPEILMIAKKLLDLRGVYGDTSLVDRLKENLYDRIIRDQKYMPVLIDSASLQKSPVGFFKKFLVDESGSRQEKFDVKDKGTSFIVDAVRVLSILSHIHETATNERISILLRKNMLSHELENDVSSALEFLLHLLMQAQLAKKEEGGKIDNVVDPERLSLLEKKSLKEVFQIIPVLHEAVRSSIERQETPAQ